jgi:hypothetical protein
MEGNTFSAVETTETKAVEVKNASERKGQPADEQNGLVYEISLSSL